jgi:transcriptional regulator with XRE-family HTH domain
MQATLMKVRQIKDVEAPNLGQRVKEARIFMSNRKTLEQILDEVELSRTYWYDIENERLRGALSIENLRKIEKVLEIDFGILMD